MTTTIKTDQPNASVSFFVCIFCLICSLYLWFIGAYEYAFVEQTDGNSLFKFYSVLFFLASLLSFMYMFVKFKKLKS
jgi:hypothetical protein